MRNKREGEGGEAKEPDTRGPSAGSSGGSSTPLGAPRLPKNRTPEKSNGIVTPPNGLRENLVAMRDRKFIVGDRRWITEGESLDYREENPSRPPARKNLISQ